MNIPVKDNPVKEVYNKYKIVATIGFSLAINKLSAMHKPSSSNIYHYLIVSIY